MTCVHCGKPSDDLVDFPPVDGKKICTQCRSFWNYELEAFAIRWLHERTHCRFCGREFTDHGLSKHSSIGRGCVGCHNEGRD